MNLWPTAGSGMSPDIMGMQLQEQAGIDSIHQGIAVQNPSWEGFSLERSSVFQLRDRVRHGYPVVQLAWKCIALHWNASCISNPAKLIKQSFANRIATSIAYSYVSSIPRLPDKRLSFRPLD